MDREAEARAIVEAAARDRRRPSRSLWIVSLVLSIACVGALAIAWLEDRDTIATEPLTNKPLTQRPAPDSSSLNLGLVVGVGLGIAIGTMIAVSRRRK